MKREALETYNEKRDFDITAEPRGELGKKKRENLMFVVQKHAARRLHYDFRLELDGVLLSWAIPKGPSLYPKDKRLAARTEDHPLSYGDFEGIIPEKQYGAGPVMVWDTGLWVPLDEDPQKALKKGRLHFELRGEKLQGEWALTRMKTKEKGENWLLIKRSDDIAIERENPDFLKETDYSVKTKRLFSDIAKGNEPKTKAVKTHSLKELENRYKGVQLATLVDHPPQSENWVHEVKYDGYRILCFVHKGKVMIRTRNGHDWTKRFGRIAQALSTMKDDVFVIDGEAVALDEKGLTDFKALQNALDVKDSNIKAYFFDLLYCNGTDYSARPFSQRREALEGLMNKISDSPLFLSETIEGKADKIIGKACDLGLEGIISKQKEAAYTQGRAKSWLKSKCIQRQEFILCGFIPASDDPKAVGALHLGIYKGKKLVYAGKVGTGFDHKTATSLFNKLTRLKTKTAPFDQKPSGSFKGTVWVQPEMVGEVKFAMWTSTGKIRHASFQGLRGDKPAKQITREAPVKPARKEKASENVVAGVTISHPDREIFPEAGVSKLDLAQFYQVMAKEIMADIENRPISVVRCPGGIDKSCFFQRSKGKGMPEHIEVIDIVHEEKTHDYIYIKNEAGLIELVQMGGIEIHPWGVRADQTEKPDRLIFDFDPDEAIPFEAIQLAAQDARTRLQALGLDSYAKVTGGKGIHVIVPIKRTQDWDSVKSFCRAFAEKMAQDTPDVYTTNMSKSKRKGKIFIDYLRNDFASTAVMDYCVRARPGAKVAVPVSWKELEKLESPAAFTMADVLKRKEGGKLFKPAIAPQTLTKTMMNSF